MKNNGALSFNDRDDIAEVKCMAGCYHKAKAVLDEMLEANRELLLQFFRGGRKDNDKKLFSQK